MHYSCGQKKLTTCWRLLFLVYSISTYPVLLQFVDFCLLVPKLLTYAHKIEPRRQQHSCRHQPFQEPSDRHFPKGMVDASCNFFKLLCVFLTNGVFLNASEKKIFNIILKVQVQKVKHQLHVQSWNSQISITWKKVWLF